MKKIIKNCIHCGKSFVAIKGRRGPVASSCSHKCTVRAYRARNKDERKHPLAMIESGASKKELDAISEKQEQALNGVKETYDQQFEKINKTLAVLSDKIVTSEKNTTKSIFESRKKTSEDFAFETGTTVAGLLVHDTLKSMFTPKRKKPLSTGDYIESLKVLQGAFLSIFKELKELKRIINPALEGGENKNPALEGTENKKPALGGTKSVFPRLVGGRFSSL